MFKKRANSLQLDHLLVQQNKFLSDYAVVMVMAKKPAFELAALRDFLQEIRQRVGLVKPAAYLVQH